MEDTKRGPIFAVIAVLVVVAVGLIIAAAVNNDDEDEVVESSDTTEVVETNDPTIVDLAVATDDLSILTTAVTEAGLVETLSGPGPYTVFAPTDAAFEALFAQLNITADELLARDDLADILTYHVVATEAFSSDLSDGQTITTVQGETLTVTIDDSGVRINDANVVTADVQASNGVVHIIDAVLLPPS